MQCARGPPHFKKENITVFSIEVGVRVDAPFTQLTQRYARSAANNII